MLVKRQPQRLKEIVSHPVLIVLLSSVPTSAVGLILGLLTACRESQGKTNTNMQSYRHTKLYKRCNSLPKFDMLIFFRHVLDDIYNQQTDLLTLVFFD